MFFSFGYWNFEFVSKCEMRYLDLKEAQSTTYYEVTKSGQLATRILTNNGHSLRKAWVKD